ncbi:MAG: hypothetical protein ACYC6Y_12905 [Thermoguttaceae bacterium]
MKRWLRNGLIAVLVVMSAIAICWALICDDGTYAALRELAHWIRR